MSAKLPLGWTWAKMLNILDYEGGSQPPKKVFVYEPRKGYVRLLQIRDFGDKPFPTYVPDSSRLKKAMCDDLLLARYGGSSANDSLGRICTGLDGAYNVALAKLIFSGDLLDKTYVKYLFMGPWFREKVSQNSRSCQTGFNREDVLDIFLPLAPLAEQRRIVMKLEGILDKVNACQKRLARIPVLLKRLRQSTLTAAYSGRLTVDWREEHSEVETASDLLARIRKERIATAQSTKEKNRVDEAFKSARAVTDGDLGFEELPTSWLACNVGMIGAVVNGSTPSRKQASFWDGNIPWVSSGEVQNNIITATRERIAKAGYENCSVQLLPPGTVLLAMIGEGKTRGQTAILRIEATINQNIAAILLTHNLVAPEFLWRWFQFQYEATRERGGGSGPQALNCQRVRELPFILPPLAEQQEIVRRVEKLFALSDRIEARYQEGKSRVDSLAQSVLAKAFCGEIVPTEAELAQAEGRSFESAEELMRRIQSNEFAPSKKRNVISSHRSRSRKAAVGN
jgi:type I restriction enzyme S subunit